MENIKNSLLFTLNSITNIPDDPTCLKATFIILDFVESLNGDVIDKEVALSALSTLNSKPLLAKYYPVTAPNTPTDHFGTHEEYETKDRYGNDIIMTDTIAIGSGMSDGYIITIKDEQGNDKEVLACDYKLWRARYPDAIDLLLEWYNRGIKINSSCEYYFQNYTVKDGVRYIDKPLWFDGHAVLNSEERNNYPVVDPAYEDSQLVSLSLNDKQRWNKAINEAIKKEGVNVKNDNADTYSITINNSKDSADMGDSWTIDEGAYFKKIKGSSNAASVFKEAYARFDKPANMDDVVEKNCGYPHHVIKDNNTMVVSSAGCKAARQRGKAEGLADDSKEMKHIKKHYNEIGLEWDDNTSTKNQKNEVFKKVCELSFGDIRSLLMEELSKYMTANEFNYVWVSEYNVFETYFIYENYDLDNQNYVYFKINYTKNADDTVTIDYASKVQVQYETVWVEMSKLTEATNQLKQANDKIEELNGKLIEKDTMIEALNKQVTESTDKLTEINKELNELTIVKEKYDKDLAEKALNEKTSFYFAKFKALNAETKFKTDEVQNLIKDSIKDSDEGQKAILKLNSMLVDLVQVKKDEEPIVKEFAEKKGSLIPTGTSFEDRYSE